MPCLLRGEPRVRGRRHRSGRGVVGRDRRRVGKARICDVVLTDARARRPVNRTPPTQNRRCPHCRRFGPHYATCAEAHAGPRYFRIDADDNEALADEHSVSKLPTFQLYRNGELASTFQGRPDESKLLAWARGEVPPFSVRDL